MKDRLLLLPILGLTCALAQAAPQDRWFRAAQSIYSDEPAGGELTGNRLDVQSLEFDTVFWRLGREGRRVSVGMDVTYLEYDFAVAPTRNLDVYTIRFPVELTAGIGPWALTGRLAPGVSTSSNVVGDLGFTGDDYNTVAQVTAHRETGANGAWVIGAAVNRKFGDTRIYPIFGLELEPSPQWRIAAVLPEPWLSHSPHERLWWGIAAGPVGDRWQIRDDDVNRRYVLRARGWRAELQCSVAVAGKLWLSLGGAWEWGRELDFDAFDGTRLHAEPGNGWRLAAGFAIGAPPRSPGWSGR